MVFSKKIHYLISPPSDLTNETLNYEQNFVHHLPNPFAICQIFQPKKASLSERAQKSATLADEIDPKSTSC